ncbi:MULTISPECIES: tRNA pseudouridine(55) synthase TruB [unclassified Spiroplasma]|uniref:tRNA pseudouridine(55) synthase TruB n=1 Tax=unclassified Spiroplasma TaxID=2637901 RepID=UPI00313E4F26
MNSGILLIDKPTGMTSHQVVSYLKKKFKYYKVGHAGTLDPLATGVLIILVNQATKISSLLLNATKEYLVTMQFNVLTNSGDITGNVIANDNKLITKEQFLNCLKFFPLSYNQIPPKYSAIKFQGKKLYEYARKDQEVLLAKRLVKLDYLELVSFDFPYVSLKVKCSKGTYIRSLVVDIAKTLNTIATVKKLQRIASGAYKISNCCELDKIQERNMISLSNVLQDYMPLINVKETKDIKNGKVIQLKDVENDTVLLTDNNQIPLAIYVKGLDNKYYCKKGLWNDENN